MRKILIIIQFIVLFKAYSIEYSLKDSLRGYLNEYRSCYDVKFYDIDIKVDIDKKLISGSNKIFYLSIENKDTIQIDLSTKIEIDSIISNNKRLEYYRLEDAVFIVKKTIKGETDYIKIFYHGCPHIAQRPPWDGGITWGKDDWTYPLIATSCEGIGASIWLPCKDHLSDKADSVRLTCSVPKPLVCVSNGKLINSFESKDYNIFTWFCSYPILNYNIAIYIGNYVHFKDKYKTIKGNMLDLDYYVMPYHLDKAKKHFKQVKKVLKAYEYYFGEYPFVNDGYALVESPFAGMEHQGAIAYGNSFKQGYDGEDYSLIGLKEDYIILHETGHEWWGNSVSMTDLADMWIHEGFCTYAEALYVEYYYGKKKANRYINAKKNYVQNDKPIIPEYNYNKQGSEDMYGKGALMLNSIRNIINDDRKWFTFLKHMQNNYKYKNITTDIIIKILDSITDIDFSDVFNKYLKNTDPPKLIVKADSKNEQICIQYKWDYSDNFSMPIIVTNKNKKQYIKVTSEWSAPVCYKKNKIKNKKYRLRNDLIYYNIKI